jgi:multiple sugar transport system substrate-binding protein
LTREELIRILDFVDKMNAIGDQRTALNQSDARWNILSYSMRRHLEGKLLTVTSVAAASGAPYATAMRRITELLDEGFLLKRTRSKSGRSYSLHPTRLLIKEFESYALQLKRHIGTTFGFTQGEGKMEDFFFGASYMAARILSFPNAMRTEVGIERTIKILGPVDPTFKTLEANTKYLNELCGATLEIHTFALDDLYEEILRNHGLDKSRYDLIAFDLPWIGELSEKQIIRPLNKIIEEKRYNSSDFHTAAWLGSKYSGSQFGIPIQPTTELMYYRKDLFADAGLSVPATTIDVLLAAKTLHKSEFGLSGIVMNYGRGTPVAHTFVQTLAAFGQPVINLNPIGSDFDTSSIEGEMFRPQINTEAGRETAEYLKELLDFAHPESMVCAWDKRIALFSAGEAAMSYGWSVRAAMFERNDQVKAYDKVGYVAHPAGPSGTNVSPIGGFSLAIPSNLPEQRVNSAWKVMEYLVRPEMMKWYVQNGNLTSPRFSTSADPEVQSFSKMIGSVDSMERRGEIQLWPRPPIPEFSDILNILGLQIYRLLQGESTIDEALNNSQNQIDGIMRDNNRY